MSGESLTVDHDKISQAAGKMAGQMAQSAAAPVLNKLQTVKDIGIGGTWIEDLIKGIESFLSKIGDYISSFFKSIFGGASAAAAPAPAPATPPAAPGAAAASPDTVVTPPGRTPPVPAANRDKGRQ